MACSSVKWQTDEWRRDLVAAFVSAMVDGGLKQRGVEAHSDVRTEHDFTALTRDARNALDNPTSALDLRDPFLLSLSSHSIATRCLNGPDELYAVNSVCDSLIFSNTLECNLKTGRLANGTSSFGR